MDSDLPIPEAPIPLGDFGQRLRRQREFHGVSRQDLAKRLGLTIQKLGNIERGESDLSIGLFCRIACALGWEPGDLLDTLLAPLLFSVERESPIDPMEIKRFRMAHGLSPEALADVCGVQAESIDRWENGEANPSRFVAMLLLELMSGRRSLYPLTLQEERLLNQALQWGNFKSREEFLKVCLVQLIQHGGIAS